MTRIRWTSGAYGDLVAIGEYIARRDPGNASRFLSELMDRTLVLRGKLLCGRVIPELDDETLRELIYKNYRVVYRVVGEEAHILTVFEAHRLLRPAALGLEDDVLHLDDKDEE